MATYVKTDFISANAHIRDACGLSLLINLSSNRWHTLKAWSIITPLVALWRYSEKLDYNIKIYDMLANSHKSHDSGTDLDFGYDESSYRKRAVDQARIIKDMLELKDEIRRISSKITVFRLGFYFDRFDNDDNLRAMEKASDKVAKFEELYGHRTRVSSMHLGMRYDYATKAYQGNTMSSGAGKFGFWGQDGDGFKRGGRWGKVFRKMDGNLAPGQVSTVASNILRDFQALDRRDPTIAHGRDPEPFSPFDTGPSEPLWA